MRMITGTTWPVEDARAYIMDRVHQVPWSGCWLWDLALDRKGYGICNIPSGMGRKGAHKAHRVAYDAYRGNAGMMHVLHKCDVPACVNPDHLWLGTNEDNVADMVAKRRNVGGPAHVARMRTSAARGSANGQAKLTEDQVREIRASQGEMSRTELANRFRVSRRTIWHILSGRLWRHVEPSDRTRAMLGLDSAPESRQTAPEEASR